MKLTKSESEKLRIALFKLARMKPTIAIGQVAVQLADMLDEEEQRQEQAATPVKPEEQADPAPLLKAMEKK